MKLSCSRGQSVQKCMSSFYALASCLPSGRSVATAAATSCRSCESHSRYVGSAVKCRTPFRHGPWHPLWRKSPVDYVDNTGAITDGNVHGGLAASLLISGRLQGCSRISSLSACRIWNEGPQKTDELIGRLMRPLEEESLRLGAPFSFHGQKPGA
ncbi:unnamed protein product [Polarella glacialis]|uniref:Uncharacterized protein n=1 Tax=Polarella glacialis TaxID=89957 RepID=A0A813LW17_POLGL|nr:unnamed protein product [Polarella glacialis]